MFRNLFAVSVLLLAPLLGACHGRAGSGNTLGAGTSIISLSTATSIISPGETVVVSYNVNSNALSSAFIVSLASRNTTTLGSYQLGNWSYLTGNISSSKSIVIPETTPPGSYFLLGDFEGHCPQNNQLVDCGDIQSLPLTVTSPTATVIQPPVAPATVYAVTGNNKMTINWSAVSGATSYNVYYSTTTGLTDNIIKIAGVAAPFTLAGLVNGTTYYFVVSAVNDAGESPASAEKSAAPVPTGPGREWSAQIPGTTNYLKGIVWGNNQFVAVGGSGTILTSPDGVTWTSQTSGSTDDLNGIAWSGTTYVVVGGWRGDVLTSPDGTTWTTTSSGIRKYIHNVIWSGTQFVAVGMDAIMTSPDGTAWTASVSDTGGKEISSISWSGNKYVAVGEGPNGFLCYLSADGVNWYLQSVDSPYNGIFNIASSGSEFAVAGPGGAVFTSYYGTAWTAGTSGVSSDFNGIMWSGNQFIAIGAVGTMVTSSDGITWTLQTPATSGSLNAVAASDDKIVAVGGTETSAVIVTLP